jgi:site-specific DNA-methyltransferase (adenine-specific)
MLEENKIHLGDCLDLMPSIPSKSIDMILCDLPYGTTACEWDKLIDMGRLWREYERVIKDNGAIVLTSNNVFSFKLWSSNPSLFRYRWIWIKSLKTQFLNANRRPLSQFEEVMIFYKRQPKYNPQMQDGKAYKISNEKSSIGGKSAYGDEKLVRIPTVNNGKYFPSDVLRLSSEIGFHPTQKPVALFEYLIKTYTDENELVLDNCSGSGTTAVACMNTNRQFICIERDEAYHRKSIERLANHKSLLHMGDKC